MKAGPEPQVRLFTALSLNPLNKDLTIHAFAKTNRTCLHYEFQIPGDHHFKVFEILEILNDPASQFAREMSGWLQSCGVVQKNADKIVQAFSTNMIDFIQQRLKP